MTHTTDKPKIGRPATGQMPQRIFRMRDDDWQQIIDAAEAEGESPSAYIRRVMLGHAGRVLKKSQQESR